MQPCRRCGQTHDAYAACPAPKRPFAQRATVVGEDEALVGNVVADRYLVGDVLGKGATGTVFAVTHTSFARAAAMKVIRPLYAEEELVSRVFHGEARAAWSVVHPGLCEVFDIGTLPDGSPFFVAERLEGETLATRIRRERMSIAAAIDMSMQLLSALAAIHARDLLLRDLRPQNVYLAHRRGCRPLLKILDFGLARLTPLERLEQEWASLRAAVGTADAVGSTAIPYYLSPERTRGENGIEPASDLFVVAAILYEALCGERPFTAPTFEELLERIRQGHAKPLVERRSDVSPELSAFLARSFSPNPRHRPASAKDMQDELRALFEGTRKGSGASLPAAVIAPPPQTMPFPPAPRRPADDAGPPPRRADDLPPAPPRRAEDAPPAALPPMAHPPTVPTFPPVGAAMAPAFAPPLSQGFGPAAYAPTAPLAAPLAASPAPPPVSPSTPPVLTPSAPPQPPSPGFAPGAQPPFVPFTSALAMSVGVTELKSPLGTLRESRRSPSEEPVAFASSPPSPPRALLPHELFGLQDDVPPSSTSGEGDVYEETQTKKGVLSEGLPRLTPADAEEDELSTAAHKLPPRELLARPREARAPGIPRLHGEDFGDADDELATKAQAFPLDEDSLPPETDPSHPADRIERTVELAPQTQGQPERHETEELRDEATETMALTPEVRARVDAILASSPDAAALRSSIEGARPAQALPPPVQPPPRKR